jgi:hypothetical protein
MASQQLKIVLGEDLRRRLDEVSDITGNSIAEEIRQRVERSFVTDALNPGTLEFVEFVMRLASQLEDETGWPWHDHPGVNEAFATAVWTRARRLGPEHGAVDFEIHAEPYHGKKIATEAERREYGRMVEWIDSRVHHTSAPKHRSVTPATDDLPAPKGDEGKNR